MYVPSLLVQSITLQEGEGKLAICQRSLVQRFSWKNISHFALTGKIWPKNICLIIWGCSFKQRSENKLQQGEWIQLLGRYTGQKTMCCFLCTCQVDLRRYKFSKKYFFQLCTCQVLVWEDRCNKQQAKEYFSYCAPVKLVWQMQTQRATDPKVTFANCTELDLRPWMPEKKWGGLVISYIFGHAKMYYDVDLPQIWVSWPHLCFWEENFEGMAFLWPLDDRQQEEERDGIVEPRRAGVKKSKSGQKNKIPKIIIPMHEGVWLSS